MHEDGMTLDGCRPPSSCVSSTFLKSGVDVYLRVIINTSPEPFTNWAVSIAEDVVVIGGLWTALHYLWLFLVLMIVFIGLMIWLLPKIWGGIKKIFGYIRCLFKNGKWDESSRNSRPVDF